MSLFEGRLKASLRLLLTIILFATFFRTSDAFTRTCPTLYATANSLLTPKRSKSGPLPATNHDKVSKYTPIFDFASTDENAVEKFERIDDAIMGGISLSSLKGSPEDGYARWSGICRLDGGGFCGTRTLPFAEPIQVKGSAEGLYLSCRLTSDDEPERRVWKITTRTEQSRGEQLYQAMFTLPKTESKETWNRIEIPFVNFVQVRGPRVVEDGEPLNKSNGLFQIGLSLSKFVISRNVTEVENFRPGFFELQIQQIGVYGPDEDGNEVVIPRTLDENERKKKQPLLLKILRPVLDFLFNEKRRRRKSAVKLLKKRGLNKVQASLFGFRTRLKQQGWLRTLWFSFSVAFQEATTRTISLTVRLFIVFPVKTLMKAFKYLQNRITKQITE